MPSLNPDGVDLVTQWYRKTLGTPFEGTGPPELYQKYVGHDNNRDWYIFSQAETRLAISKLHNVWHPQIVYDVHQQGAYASRMFVPPWMDPIDPNIDADHRAVVQCDRRGHGCRPHLRRQDRSRDQRPLRLLDARPALSGVSRRHFAFSASRPARGLPLRSAFARTKSSQMALGYNPRERSWNYLEPWLGGEWRLRDIVDYQLIAFESCLYQAAVRREDLLRASTGSANARWSASNPHAFVISANQRDPGAATKLLETLAFGQVEIDRSQKPFTAAGKTISGRQLHHPNAAAV